MTRAATVGFLMDRLEGVRVGHDTTFALMLEATRRGCEVRCFEQPHLGWRDGLPTARMRTVTVRADALHPFTVQRDAKAPLAELDVLFLRKDPPVDVEFLHATQLVELRGKSGAGPLLINSPSGLREANEKLYALNFPELIPTTLVSRQREELVEFIDSVGGKAVLKPLDGFGGLGVLVGKSDDENLSSLLETITRQGTTAVMAQRFLPEVKHGDKRVLVLNGEPLGAVMRVAQAGDFRCNMAAGGHPEKTALTAQERAACEVVGQRLLQDGLYFVGLDFIGERLTEVNVTSPTGLVELEALDGPRAAARVLDFALGRALTRPTRACPSPAGNELPR